MWLTGDGNFMDSKTIQSVRVLANPPTTTITTNVKADALAAALGIKLKLAPAR